MSVSDVAVIGGGVIGLSIANELLSRGASVTLLDRQAFGQEASWAGAGMLPPGNPQSLRGVESQLRGLSSALWPQLSAQLFHATGIDNEYHVCGAVEVRPWQQSDIARSQADLEHYRQEMVPVKAPAASEVQCLVPQLNPNCTVDFILPGFAQVRNPRHLAALLSSIMKQGAQLHPQTEIREFQCRHSRIISAISTTGERFYAREFVIASGAWSAKLLANLGINLELQPVRGQIALLNLAQRPFQPVIQMGLRYLVPRRDGRVLIGATQEHVGFNKETTTDGINSLLEFAYELVPELAAAPVEKTWSGLRPFNSRELPYVGRVPGYENFVLAAGHFRAGLQLSPVTAKLVGDLLESLPSQIDLASLAIPDWGHNTTPEGRLFN